ncbi:MAG TPA: nucleotide exchange factor GrpE [Spirochaetota bacterium]|nr:nucleotide exchange factor GrpE [Spirochaetota bacterium]HPI88176.1 nucleotide exchange factor GrpE [Spirochaetota bacterium]HPR47951.1 nucleotide exchange factor GrpE [Spirochaetota bacterium]
MDKKTKIVDAEKEKFLNGEKVSLSDNRNHEENVKDERRKNDRRSIERRFGDDRRKELRRSTDRDKGGNVISGRDEKISQMDTLLQEKENEIIRLKNEVDSFKDILQRRQADFENYKKRTLKYQEEQKKYGIKDFALDIILINDDLIRAIEAASQIDGVHEETSRSFVDGVNMISRRIEESLEKYGVVEIDSLNQPFNPNYHEAVEIEMNGDYPVDTVTKIYQKGFRIDELVVRSTKVKVAKSVVPPVAEEKNKNGGSGESINQAGEGKPE